MADFFQIKMLYKLPTYLIRIHHKYIDNVWQKVKKKYGPLHLDYTDLILGRNL